MKFNHPIQKILRQRLRAESPEPEKLLWERLRQKRLAGFKFRRQYGIGRYIVDFYCPARRLAVELDGAQHAELEAKEYDKARTAYINSFNIGVLRFWNTDVMNDIDTVCDEILYHLSSS